MNDYKCVNCGTTAESEDKCICPNCGYMMFMTPYDRMELLRKEIVEFLGRLRPSEINDDYFHCYRIDSKNNVITKEEDDDQRFPDFKKIQSYVCAADKTEEFCDRLFESVEEIGKHLNTDYSQSYMVNLDALMDEMSKYDLALREAIKELNISSVDISDMKFPEMALQYRETTDPELETVAGNVLDHVAKTGDKIRQFIKANNIYGTLYKKAVDIDPKLSENEEYISDLNRVLEGLERVLSKTYTVDIFSDGADELDEMLQAVWNAIAVVMTVPVLKKGRDYHFSDGTVIYDDSIKSTILNMVDERFLNLDQMIYANDFLADRSEEELFDLYDRMIELDEFGLLGLNKDNLLNTEKSEKELHKLVGLTSIKENVKKIKAYALANKDSDDLNMHMCFYGNPGSGKTEVARIIAGILYENKILPTKKVVEVDRGGLIGQYVGETPQKTMSRIQEAMGGVLFIDEAYALIPKESIGGDYGHEAVATLIKAMEDYRGKFCVIMAGYKNEMFKMLDSNPGFKSRIQFELDFPNYSREELSEIASIMIRQRAYTISDSALSKILDITDIKRKEKNFANARELRNIIDQVIMTQNLRCLGSDNKELALVDVNKYIEDAGVNLPTSGEGYKKKLLSGEEELEELVGLTSVKRMIKKIKAYAKKNQGEEDFNLHMCFYGNPGTGKTEVARILSRILYDIGVLGEAKLVETDAHGLMGQFVGETAPKTLNKINDAENGVLFIDEAYGLVNAEATGGRTNGYGEEAIAVLLKEMEDRRGQFCVILAGYKNEMKNMIDINPGLASRIQFTLDFPDYSREELGEIARRFLGKKKYEIDSSALDRVVEITDYYREKPNFANARTVRNVLDHVIMNQNLRTENHLDDKTITLEDVDDYLVDEGIDLLQIG